VYIETFWRHSHHSASWCTACPTYRHSPCEAGTGVDGDRSREKEV